MEVWKDVIGYEGLYLVSDSGTVKRAPGIIQAKNRMLSIPGGNLKPLDNGKGYFRVKLTKENSERRIMLHRIIADAFIPNPKNLPFINHKDGNKKNNSIDNLEWCSRRTLNRKVNKSEWITI